MRVRTETATPEYELVALHGCAGAIRKRSMKRRACCRTADRGCSSRRCAAGCIIACTGSRFRTAIRYLHVSLSLLVHDPTRPPCECFVCCVHPPHVRTIRHAPHADGHRQAYTVYSKLAMDTATITDHDGTIACEDSNPLGPSPPRDTRRRHLHAFVRDADLYRSMEHARATNAYVLVLVSTAVLLLKRTL